MTVTSNANEITKALKRVRMTPKNMLDIHKPAALTVVNYQKRDVPVDTAATKLSIDYEVVTASKTIVTSRIGPKTDYAPSIEFGIISKPNYPIQPFVRTSVAGAAGKTVLRVAKAAFKKVFQEKVTRSFKRRG